MKRSLKGDPLAMENTTSIEVFIQTLQPAIIVVLMVLLLRFILNRIFTSLAERGTLTISTKATIMRFVDIAVFFIIIVAVLQILVAPYQVLLAVSILVLLASFLFFYELCEFLAYINLQLLRHLRGRTFEIYLPNHSKPIYGRIVNIDLLSSTIEDIYGRKIHVSNSLLMNSVLREHIPSIMLKITLRNVSEDPSNLLLNLMNSLRELDAKVFRIDEKKLALEKVGSDSLTFKLIVYPTATPVRIGDIVNLVKMLNMMMNKYDPLIEVVELV